MRISFVGGASTVTGSKFLVSHNDEQILIDCGLFQGVKQLRLLNWEKPDLDIKKIKAVFITHAHLDHCGYLPLLVKSGYNGPIYCSPPTLEICKIVLEDAAKIQMEEADYANKKKFSKHHPALPLYDLDDVAKTIPLMEAVEFNTVMQNSTFEIEYKMNGHILGSASLYVSNGRQKILFSGDLGRSSDPLMPPPTAPEASDIIVMESTYGDRIHSQMPSSEQLRNLINKCWERKSILLIPAFALGRGQNILYEIMQLKKKSLIPQEMPVYFNSPMGREICALYAKYPDYMRPDTHFRDEIQNVRFIKSAEESKNLNDQKSSSIIVAASGMLTGGRVLHHLKSLAGDPKNIILLAGFQAQGTRGADLEKGKRQLKIHGNMVDINAEIIASDSFSAHADQSELLSWLQKAPTPPKHVFLVHGEPSSADEFRKLIELKLGLKVSVPLLNSQYDLEGTT